MFWNDKTKQDAQALAKFLLQLHEMSINKTLGEFAELCRRRGFEVVEHSQNTSESQGGECPISFTIGTQPWDDAEFVHSATSYKDVSGEAAISFITEGQHRFFGFSVYGSGLPFRAQVRAYDKSTIGRDAPKLLAQLLRIPGFKQFPASGDWRAWLEN